MLCLSRNERQCLELALLIIVAGLFCPLAARGDEFRLIPSVGVRQTYDDNIFFEEKNTTDDIVTTISPALRLIEKTERLNAMVSSQIDWVLYLENDDFNAADQRHTAKVSYRLNERLGLSSEAGYVRDSRKDRDVEETGLVLGTDTRDRYQCSLAGDYALSEKAGGALSYAYQQDDFDDPESTDYHAHTLNLGISYNLSRLISQTSARVNLGYAQYTYPSQSVDYYSLSLGASREISETLSLLISAGARCTVSELSGITSSPVYFSDSYPDIPIAPEDDFIIAYQPVPYHQKSETWGAVGQIALTYKGERTGSKLSLARDVREASGLSGTTERTSLIFDADRRFTEKFRGDISFKYYLNQSDQKDASDINEQTFRMAVRLRCDFTEEMRLEASHVLTFVADEEAGTDSKRNAVFFRFVFLRPWLE